MISSGLLRTLEQELGYNLFESDSIHTYHSLMPAHDPVFRNMIRPLAVSAVNERLSEQVYEQAFQGRYVLTLGGDHSLAIGSIAGSAEATRKRLGKEIAVIWVDAHADINTPETSTSGNIHGMPLSFLTGLAKEERKDIFGWLRPEQLLSPSKLVYIALRDVDPGEEKILEENDIKVFSMHEVEGYVNLSLPKPPASKSPDYAQIIDKQSRYSIARVMDMALEYIGPDTPIHLSFDIDGLNPQYAPSTGTPVTGGLTLRQGQFICERLHKAGTMVAMDLVCYLKSHPGGQPTTYLRYVFGGFFF